MKGLRSQRFSAKVDTTISVGGKTEEENETSGWRAEGGIIILQEFTEEEVGVINMTKQELDDLVAFSKIEMELLRLLLP